MKGDAGDGAQRARAALREFLMTRRARVTPQQAGLTTYGTQRRVPGLRREEVAMLAGISAEYYTRLERGHAKGPSSSVVGAIAAALQLTTVEREHLTNLIDAVTGEGTTLRRVGQSSARTKSSVRPQVQVLLDSITELPAFVFNRRTDIVACNRMGRLLYAPMFEDDPARPVNTARFAFLSPRAREFWPDWEQLVDTAVAILQTEAGRNPHHAGLIELIGQLSTGSQEFRARWAAHNVRDREGGVKSLRHPLLGVLTMPYENLTLDGDPDHYLMVYTPTPGSPMHDSLKLLASWADDQLDGANAHHGNSARSDDPQVGA